MRLGLRTTLPLAACAATAAASVAHVLIDVIGDFALPHDTYDDIAHASRGLASGIALILAFALALGGLRICCELAARYRHRLPRLRLCAGERFAFLFATLLGAVAGVPAMECLDDRLAGVPVHSLADAFGGSILLGVATTVICAALVGWLVYALARWLVSHRDHIAAIIETLVRRHASSALPRVADLSLQLRAPRRRRAPHALRLCKRGPPMALGLEHHEFSRLLQGDSREPRTFARVACARRARNRAHLCIAGVRCAGADADRQHCRHGRRQSQRRPAPRR
ncbi:MAG: hypothetical protein WBE83_10675 [Candidatus Cybelea sp.]